jgi:hypothetical protein
VIFVDIACVFSSIYVNRLFYRNSRMPPRRGKTPAPALVYTEALLLLRYFNDSTGTGDHGERDTHGPWNQGNGWEVVEAPALQELRGGEGKTRSAGR